MTLTTPIHRTVTLSTRYDVNLNSFDSDVVTGMLYEPKSGREQLRIRASWRDGIALSMSAVFGGGLKGRIGVASGPIWVKPTGVESVPTGIRVRSPSIGFEVSFEQ